MSFYYDSPEYYDGEDYAYATAFDQPDVQSQLYGSLEKQVKEAGGTLGTKYQTPVGTSPPGFGGNPILDPINKLFDNTGRFLTDAARGGKESVDKAGQSVGQASDLYGKGISAALKNLSDQSSKAGQGAGDFFGANIGGIPIIPILIGGVVLVFLLKK